MQNRDALVWVVVEPLFESVASLFRFAEWLPKADQEVVRLLHRVAHSSTSPPTAPASSGLYLLDVDGRRHVMRIQRCGGGALLALPESDDHDSEVFKPITGGSPDTYRSRKSGFEREIRVVGRVVRYGKFA